MLFVNVKSFFPYPNKYKRIFDKRKRTRRIRLLLGVVRRRPPQFMQLYTTPNNIMQEILRLANKIF